jgi:hypothetical protein
MSQPGGDANADQYAPIDSVETGTAPAVMPPRASSYYSMLDFMCVPCYGSGSNSDANSCLYTGAAPTKYDPRDVPMTSGSPYVMCQPPAGVYTNCYFPESSEASVDACSNIMFEQGMASSLARRGGGGGGGQAQTAKSLEALATLAAQRQQACPNYLCKNDSTYKGESGRASFATSSCSCVSEPVATSLQQRLRLRKK